MKKAGYRIYNVIRSIVVAAILAVTMTYVVLYLFISIPSIQGRIRQVGSSELGRLLGTEVGIGGINITPFNQLVLYDVVLPDLQGDTILQADKVGVGFSVFNLIAHRRLVFTYAELIGVDEKEYILKNSIETVKDQYDYIIIDCPPSLNMLTINAMTTADTVLVPIQCEYYALEGLSQLIHTIELVQERLNPELEMEGVVFTMYDARTNLSLQVVENVKNNLNQTIYKTIIPRNVRLAEAPSHGLPINYYDGKSTGAESYRLLAEEVMHRGDEEWQ